MSLSVPSVSSVPSMPSASSASSTNMVDAIKKITNHGHISRREYQRCLRLMERLLSPELINIIFSFIQEIDVYNPESDKFLINYNDVVYRLASRRLPDYLSDMIRTYLKKYPEENQVYAIYKNPKSHKNGVIFFIKNRGKIYFMASIICHEGDVYLTHKLSDHFGIPKSQEEQLEIKNDKLVDLEEY